MQPREGAGPSSEGFIRSRAENPWAESGSWAVSHIHQSPSTAASRLAQAGAAACLLLALPSAPIPALWKAGSDTPREEQGEFWPSAVSGGDIKPQQH